MSSSSISEGMVITREETAGVSKLRESYFPSSANINSHGMLDDACLVRYLRARDGNVEKAAAMLSATLDWRRDFDVDQIVRDSGGVIAKENATGKVYMSGFDRQGRPVMVMRPKNENTMDYEGNIKHITYQMERARAILQKTSGGLGKICLVIDYEGYSLRNAPPMKTSMQTLKILQNHYPETLGVAYFLSPPFFFRGFWKVIYPFIDRQTKDKFCFVAGNIRGAAAQAILAKNFDLDQLEEALGGKYTTAFDSAVYLAAPMDHDFRSALSASHAEKKQLAPESDVS